MEKAICCIFIGPGTANSYNTSFYPEGPGNITIELDTRPADSTNWIVSSVVNGALARSNPFGFDPLISYVGMADWYDNGVTVSNLVLKVVNLAAPSVITVRVLNGQLRLTFTAALQSANSVAGPWGPVSGASSPYSIPMNAPQQFFRAVP